MQDVYLLDETGFQPDTDLRTMGKSFQNEIIPIVTTKNFGMPTWSVLGAVGFNQGVIHAVPLPCNYNHYRKFSSNAKSTATIKEVENYKSTFQMNFHFQITSSN